MQTGSPQTPRCNWRSCQGRTSKSAYQTPHIKFPVPSSSNFSHIDLSSVLQLSCSSENFPSDLSLGQVVICGLGYQRNSSSLNISSTQKWTMSSTSLGTTSVPHLKLNHPSSASYLSTHPLQSSLKNLTEWTESFYLSRSNRCSTSGTYNSPTILGSSTALSVSADWRSSISGCRQWQLDLWTSRQGSDGSWLSGE